MSAAKDRGFLSRFESYSPQLLESVAARVGRFSRGKKGAAAERIEKAFSNPKLVARLVEDLEPSARQVLSAMASFPAVALRWDHAVRLLTACGVSSPYRQLQTLLGDGLIWMRGRPADQTVHRFELPADVVCELAPIVGISAPAAQPGLTGSFRWPSLPVHPGDRWRRSDGWDVPIRLALLWRLARNLPIRKTQQNLLFKRDQERILQNPMLTAPLLDAAAPIAELGEFIYAVGAEQRLLIADGDEESATPSLIEFWPTSLHEALAVSARAYLAVEDWNELGQAAPPGTFTRETITARLLLMLLLSSVEEGQGVAIDDLVRALVSMHPPWNASGEMLGPLRNETARIANADAWTRAALLGPMYQLGLVEIGASTSAADLVRITPLGRHVLGIGPCPPDPESYPQTLFVQPNHSIVVYRQGLNIELIVRLVEFAEARSIGAALTFELTAESVYRGLEAGLSAGDVIAILERHGARELPAGVAASVRTWSQKRDRLTVYASCSLLEFSDAGDLERALQAGLEGVRINDRILLVAGEQERRMSALRVVSSRDYRLPPEPCVQPTSDGVTLEIDAAKSDLMLDAEIQRFAIADHRPNGVHDRKLAQITAAGMRDAVERGLSAEMLEDWFQRRTGGAVPPSVLLLFHAVNGVELRAVRRCIVRADCAAVADGLMQHPRTKDFFEERIGPDALVVPENKLEELQRVLGEWGIAVAAEVQSEGRT